MPTLSSILVQRGAATIRAVEDAIARQVFHGGDLATNLLETGAVREDALNHLVAESFGLEPAPGGRLQIPAPDVLRLVPGELALRHGMFPLALRDRSLVLAVAEPLQGAVEDDLGFALDVAVRQLVAPLVRIRQAIADAYGIALDRRFLRLQAKLDGRADPSPSAVPPPEHGLLPAKMPRPVSIPVPSFGTGLPGQDAEPARLDQAPARKTPFVALAHDTPVPVIPKSPALPFVGIDGTSALPGQPEASAPPDQPEAPVAEETAPAPAEEAPPVATAPRSAAATRALAGVLRLALKEERSVDKNKPEVRRPSGAWRAPLSRRKGPFTTAMAEHELEEAASSDDVLGILFAFAHQFFAYAALFVVHGDLAEGREAAGAGADRATVAGLKVQLDRPGSLAEARTRQAPVLVQAASDGTDADLLRDLDRARSTVAREVAFLPVVVRRRTVAVLFGDDDDASVELSSLGDVLRMIGLAGAALERIALRKKLGARAPEVPLRVRIQDGAAALARAINASAADVSRSAPPTIVDPSPAFDAPAMEEHEVAPAPAHATATPTPRGPVGIDPAPAPPPPAPPEDDQNPLAIAAPPRTARYFDDPPPEPIEQPRQTEPGIGLTREPEAPPPDPAADDWAAPEVRNDTPPPQAVVPAASPPSRRVVPGRRGPAPHYEGRNAAVPAGASMEWVSGPAVSGEDPPAAAAEATAAPTEAGARPKGPLHVARTLPSMGLAPLPSTPPPNATAWTSFPSPPPPLPLGDMGRPPATASQAPPKRSPSTRPAPIPREEVDDSSPSWRRRTPPGPPSDTVVFASDPPLPSVVVDVGAEHAQLIQRVIEGGHRGQEAFDELVRNGEQVVQAVMARFPGPLRVDRHRARGELPAASQCGPILELAVAIRRPALPFISVRTSAHDPEVRFWATHALGELRYAEAATVLVPRLFDDDAQVRRIARRSAAALVGAGAAGSPILKGLEDITRNPDQPRPHRLLAIETMGEIRSGSLVPPLLSALDDGSEEVADAARRALLLITRQDFGRDGRSWQAWWAENGEHHRIEWLIDALMHEQPSVRRAAGDELKLLTKEYFGYYDDLPRRERERAQGLYRSWWEREGRARFS